MRCLNIYYSNLNVLDFENRTKCQILSFKWKENLEYRSLELCRINFSNFHSVRSKEVKLKKIKGNKWKIIYLKIVKINFTV